MNPRETRMRFRSVRIGHMSGAFRSFIDKASQAVAYHRRPDGAEGLFHTAGAAECST